MKRLTIFTSTYNRAYTLPKLYDSLCEQTCQDFEWLVVDDGSTDHTKELVKGWINEKNICIRYFFQENGGKMRAYNKAISLTETELFVCIDSDDLLENEFVLKDSLAFWDKNLHNGFPSGANAKYVAGWISLRKMPYSPDEILILPYCDKLVDIASSIIGETTIFIRTNILKCYRYWVHPNENFIPDSYIYDNIDEDYLFLFHPYYSQVCEYKDDGLTLNWRRKLFDNPYSYREYHAQRIRLKKSDRWRSVICYISISIYIGDGSLWRETPDLLSTIFLFPIGCLKYIYDRYMLNKEK